jgi:glycolate oxidase FAD binding subunit
MNPQPTSPPELLAIVKSGQLLLPRAGGTKPALSAATNGTTLLDLSRLSGMIEYEPDEYTFTAYAGTPVREVAAELAKNRQYLPFDPLLVDRGATLGGTVAANASGPGRYRYGGVRDFILGLHFVDGQGQLVRSGGKVVKNSAGFDLPKFMVGSLGRYGVFVDLTFKVFPAPRSNVTLTVTYPNLAAALQATYRLASAPFDIDVLDLEPRNDHRFAMLVRIGGLEAALSARTERLQAFLDEARDAIAIEVAQDEVEAGIWQQVREFGWVTGGLQLIKVPIPPKRIPNLEDSLPQARWPRRYSAGGNVAWLTTVDVDELDPILTRLALAGLVFFGPAGRPYVGARQGLALASRVKRSLDPAGRFPDA